MRLDNNKLHFQNIALDDGGIYQCVATNKHGMIVSQTWVNIVGEYYDTEKENYNSAQSFSRYELCLKSRNVHLCVIGSYEHYKIKFL